MDATAHRDSAVEALAARNYQAAGDAYTRAGRAGLADPRSDESLDPFSPDKRGWVGRGLQYLCIAAIAYRVAGRNSRATYRGVEGAAAARDLRTALTEPVQQALLTEFVGDFHIAGNLSGARDVYTDAEDRYEQAAPEDPMTWATTPLFEAANTVIQQVARGPANGEIAVQWDDLHGPDPNDSGPYLAHRANYKARRLPSLVTKVIDENYLAAPRGTTEYNNDDYRCPECSSTDVNWTGGSIFCMRCSTPVERRS
jgi:hypothetical protein